MRVSVSSFNQFLYVPEKYICLIFANEYEPVLDTEERVHFIEFAMFCLTSAVVLGPNLILHTTFINFGFDFIFYDDFKICNFIFNDF